jgi:hypothetical protein
VCARGVVVERRRARRITSSLERGFVEWRIMV